MVVLRGLGATASSATGVVRIVTDDASAKEFSRGDILATQMTSPDMMELLLKASGWVTAHGGRTCHAAVVARQMNKPCVVGLGDGFRSIRSGGFVTVDGVNGTVTLLD